MTDVPPPFDIGWVKVVIGFVWGGLLGSFASVLGYRIPRGLSIVAPRSHCVSCNKTLGVIDLIPVFSWFLFRGRCRYCNASIGVRYLLIEIASGTACALIVYYMGYDFKSLLASFVVLAVVSLVGARK